MFCLRVCLGVLVGVLVGGNGSLWGVVVNLVGLDCVAFLDIVGG